MKKPTREWKPPKDYSNQWDILPYDKSEFKACCIYEYSRENPILLGLIIKFLQKDEQNAFPKDTNMQGFAILDTLHDLAPLLATLVRKAKFLELKKGWTVPWIKLPAKIRSELVSSITYPIREATRQELKVALHQDSDQAAQFFSPSLSDNGEIYMEPQPMWREVTPSQGSLDPRIFLPLVIDTSLSAAEMTHAFRIFINEHVTKNLPQKKGPDTKEGRWKQALLDLAALRILSTRSTEKARTVVGKIKDPNRRPFQPENRNMNVTSESTVWRRIKQAPDNFNSFFDLLKQSRHVSDTMTSLTRFKEKHPKRNL